MRYSGPLWVAARNNAFSCSLRFPKSHLFMVFACSLCLPGMDACRGVFFSSLVFVPFPLHFVRRFMTAEPFQISVSSTFSWLFSRTCGRSKLVFLWCSVFSAENDFPLSANRFFVRLTCLLFASWLRLFNHPAKRIVY